MKIFCLILSLLFLVYLMVPGPTSVKDFPALSNSFTSKHEGDTVQVPNVAAYYSDYYRNFVTMFYRDYYQSKNLLPFLPIRINYPPEFAFIAIKDQTQSTYLEEFVYPLRSSIFINGLEQYYEDGRPKFWGSQTFKEGGKEFLTKATIRYYPSSIPARLGLWILINLSCLYLYKIGRRVIRA